MAAFLTYLDAVANELQAHLCPDLLAGDAERNLQDSYRCGDEIYDALLEWPAAYSVNYVEDFVMRKFSGMLYRLVRFLSELKVK